ncbi:hypothetical protein PFNF54_01345 [Plasmodium falciparum NF54]|uniref:RAP domain-containing protein n=1 Tax=Plasmodium falciparum (isolate NF54) TaxID=5843 RepID=W7JYQ0_PLAFO|nr:hypothetical protein PFNF54_01345 [Plasmodium falciparum NF54]
MFMKRYKILIKNVNTFKWKSYEVKRISSIILNSKKSKPFNIDYIEKVKKKNGLKDGCNKVFLKNKYNGEKYERDKNITRWCDKLNEYAKNKEYDVYENGLNSCSCIAENSIEISQLINVISKNKIINNNIMLIYIKLIDKCLKIFSNIPMRSVSLILNSMVKLNYYHTNFIDLFFKNINNIIDKSNPIDLSILYHFYVNCSGDYFEYINDNKNDIYLNLFLNKILNDISLLQIQAISCILRCNKKIIKRKNWEHAYFKYDGVLEENYLNVQVNEKNKTMDYNKGYEEKEIEKKRIEEGTYKRGIIYDDEKTYYNMLSIKKEKSEELDNNINFFECDNIKLIKKVNNILKEHVYFKISSGNIQQLCNILEDLEYFNLIDDDYNFYYDILNMLKNSCNLFELKNIDYINILNIIKTRNMKYNNFLPISNFSFLFDKIKDLDFDFFTCDHLCELIKILCYFKKCYHLNMCMYKLEACLEKKNFDDIYSTSTLIYLLYDFSQINRNDMIIHSLCKKLYISIINKINKSCDDEKVNDFKYVETGKNIKTTDKKNAMYKTEFNICIKEYILLLKSMDKLLDKRIITPLCIDEKKLNSFFLDITYKINENPSKNSFKCRYKNNDYYDYEMCLYLYQILLLGKLKSRNYVLFLSCLYNVLTLSIHFNIKDVVLCLKILHHCTHFITKDRYLIFENTLNYFSHLILSNNVILLERKNILMNNIKNNFIKINKNNMNYVEENCNDNIDILNNLYKNINRIIDDNNYMYINKTKANHYLNGSIMTKSNNDEIYTMCSNFDYTKIACIDCCNILYYLKKLNYVNKDLINIILKNVYINISSLKKQKYILRMVNGLSIIKNIDKEFKDFNCIVKKMMFHFFFIQQEHNNNMSQNIRLEESIKLFYLLSKLDMSKKYKNDLITKYMLVRLENILEKKKTTINNIILLLYGIKNMYPYRYISLISYVLHCIDDYQTRINNINRDTMNSDNIYSDNMNSDNMNSDNIYSDNMNSDNMNSDNIYSDNMNSDNINSDHINNYHINNYHTNEDDVLCSVSFLKSYFSSIPHFIDSWIDNTCSKINQVYIRISQKLFQNFYEHIFLENKMKNEDMICMLIDYINLSLPYIPYIEKYLDVIHYVIDMHKVVINKDEFITFLLNWKIYIIYRINNNNNDYGDNEETQKLVYKIDECLNMLCKNDNSYNYNDFISLNKSLEKGNKKNDTHNNDDENVSLNKKSVYDFSFNKKKIIFLDTDEDNEKDIICKEYNYIDINKLYENNFNRKINNNINQNKKLQFCIQKEDNEKNKIFKNIIINNNNNNNNKNKNILNEFEIILNKYSYCQNNQNDKIEILKNVKLYSFHIKFIDKKKKIIFEFLDEDAYFKEPDNSSIDLLPSVNLKLTLLKKLNFKIITIPFYEWNKCYGRLEKVKSIYQKLLNVTNPQNAQEEYQNYKSDDIFSSIGRYEITKKK